MLTTISGCERVEIRRIASTRPMVWSSEAEGMRSKHESGPNVASSTRRGNMGIISVASLLAVSVRFHCAGICSSLVRRAVRRQQADHAPRAGHESRVAEPAHLGLPRRERGRRHGDAVAVRRRRAERAHAPGMDEQTFTIGEDHHRRLAGEGRHAHVQREDVEARRRTPVLAGSSAEAAKPRRR